MFGGPPTLHQLTFTQDRARTRGPSPAPLVARRREHIRTLRSVAGLAQTESVIRDAALDAIKRELAEFIVALGVGATFQAADFTRRLDEVGGRPGIDLRATGAMYSDLHRAGIITRVGYQPTGCYGGARSSARPLYRIDSIDLARLDWPCLRRSA